MVTGLAWDAGSGIVKDNLGDSGSMEEGEWLLAVGGVLSSAQYSADTGVKEMAANKDPTLLGACCEVGRMAWRGGGGGASCVLDASLQEDDGGGCDPQVFPRLLKLV